MLGLGSYRTAWMLAGKLRRAMVDPQRAPLSGLIEADESTLPLRTKEDPPAGGGGRSLEGKMAIAGAVEISESLPSRTRGGGVGRLRLQAIDDYSAQTLHAFLTGAAAPGSEVKTDGWSGYPNAPGVVHDPHVVGKMAAHVVLPTIHTVFSNLKSWPSACPRESGERLPWSAAPAPAELSRR